MYNLSIILNNLLLMSLGCCLGLWGGIRWIASVFHHLEYVTMVARVGLTRGVD